MEGNHPPSAPQRPYVWSRAYSPDQVEKIDEVTGGAWIDLGAGEQPADLLSKVTRCLIENAAILGCGGIDIEMLNRAD